ncbi:uncharacterized protein LOC135386889 [Ornithodoros turicata]|uniref:uncharacterized protein LOC135386889 n=1 Tax=Ornithodoros turicata TaxID=34597 RepID=UPI0031396D16
MEAERLKKNLQMERQKNSDLMAHVRFLEAGLEDRLTEMHTILKDMTSKLPPTACSSSSEKSGFSTDLFKVSDVVGGAPFETSDEELTQSGRETSTFIEPWGRSPSENSSLQPSSEPLQHGRMDTGVFDSTLTSMQPLTKMTDGRFHVRNGFFLTEIQAEKIFKNKRPTLVMKEVMKAQAVWGNDILATRTYSGRTAPKDRGDPDTLARKELTPTKVSLVIDAVTHGGRKMLLTSLHALKRGASSSQRRYRTSVKQQKGAFH